MTYETTPVKGTTVKASAVLSHYSTAKIIGHLLNRHKVGLLATWAIIITIVQIFPPAPDMVLSLIGL